MSDSVIQVEKLSKRFEIGERERFATFRDMIARKLAAPFRTDGHRGVEVLWALRDVSFDVKQGEVVGLIGRNGAGKSTLLKILSRITRPTTGWAKVCGRIASLLEVGTGFHPELTGRENVFLNGAILGMSKREIVRKFDEIVAFAEVERFIDTPVKRYSSGMYVRLAFAVAAHLDPEILLVDEVLAVGDLSFQNKCLGKMQDASETGRTIIFISHQMNQIRRLCQRVLWIDYGRLHDDGPTQLVASAYESAMAENKSAGHNYEGTSEKSRFISWELVQPPKTGGHVLDTFGPLTVKFRVEVREPVRNGHHGIALYDKERRLLWGNASDNIDLEPGVHDFCHELPFLPLRPGPYTWLVSLWQGGVQLDAWDCIPEMTVTLSLQTHRLDEWAGVLNVPSQFMTENVGVYDS